jgi:hypothetical protein
MHLLERLRAELAASPEDFADPDLYARLSVVEAPSGYHIDFFGQPLEAPFEALCGALTSPEVAGRLVSLKLRCPDEGANGTCNWDLSGLADADVTFGALRMLAIQQNGPGQHNRIIVAASYDEDGVLARLLKRSPRLEALTTPSAPDKAFFEHDGHPLRYLSVDAGYDHQSFVRNLTESSSFPQLRALEYGDYQETYVEGWEDHRTPLADYEDLVRSPAVQSLRTLTLRNPALSDAQVADLCRALPQQAVQLELVRFSARHLRQERPARGA